MRVPHQVVEPNGRNGKVDNCAGSYLRVHDDLESAVCSGTPRACNGVLDATRAGLNNGTKVVVWLLNNGDVDSSAG